MSKTLGGSLFVHNGLRHDYCFEQAIQCLQEFCDEVSIVDAGSDDGTTEIVRSYADKKTKVICLDKTMWDSQQGRQKLSYFSNIAHSALDTDYFFNIQADEILHENSYGVVRKAIEQGDEAFFAKRINLWKTPLFQLNVPQNRKPCSTEIIRLAKNGYRSFDDAESLQVPLVSADYVNEIILFHYGFVRSKQVHADKVRYMQKEIFLIDPDVKLNGMTEFEPERWFSDEDLLPMPAEQHPAIMQEWIKHRP